MATESVVTTSAATGAIKTFVTAHPITVAIVGGLIVAGSALWVMNKYFNKSEEAAA